MNENNDESEKNLPKLPKKLDNLISNIEIDEDNDVIVGDGEIDLKSTQPVSVVEYFISSKYDEWSGWTLKDYSYDLTRFLEYCAYADIDDLQSLSSRDLEGFRNWRKKDGNINLTSLHGQLANIRVFIRNCERLELIEKGLADEIEMPDLDDSDVVSYVRIRTEEAKAILDYHEQHDYAKRRHAEFAVMWALLCRLGDIRSLDLENYDTDEEGNPYLEFEHSPEEDTPLKNGANDAEGKGGERQLNVPDWVCEILDDYIEHEREDVEDEYGRQPLFSTEVGRVSESTIRRDMYRITQPCRYGTECPYDIEPSDCKARNKNSKLAKCPSTVSPHPVRRGGICHQLKQGVPKDTICERADVSRSVLDRHYDLRTKEEARIQRRQELKKHLDGYDSTERHRGYNKSGTGRCSQLAAASPLVEDTLRASSRLLNGLTEVHPNPSFRTAKGLAGYAAFVSLSGINLGLMGIGFNPLTMELFFNVW